MDECMYGCMDRWIDNALSVFKNSCNQAVFGYGAQDALPFRTLKEGELFLTEDRDINLVELALATNIPKGSAETMVRGMICVSKVFD